MAIKIKPKKLTVPDEPFYPIDRLYLFDRFDRMSWERTFGEQAPPFDPARPPKRWADTSALEGVADADAKFVEYDYFDFGSRTFKKLRLTAREAATPNLPGAYVFPKYEPAPTPAVVRHPDRGASPLNPVMLSTREEAEALRQELGGESVVENTMSEAGPFRVDWQGERRRMWLVRIGNQYYNVGLLLARKYRYGVGAPGEWSFSPIGQPTWTPKRQATGENDPRPEVPVPTRTLAANEAIYLGHPMKVIVYRTDRESEFNRPDAGQPAFPPDVRTILERIDANLQQLLAMNIMRLD